MSNAKELRILDLYCCEGGASAGYADAGFKVYGVDKDLQPRYPFPFHQGDAIDVMRRLRAGEAIPFTHPNGDVELLRLEDFAAAAASPPCQAYSITKHSHSNEHPDLLEPTREGLVELGLPYIIENVPGAPLRQPIMLCGSMFGLRAEDVDGTVLALRRHRLFETSFDIPLAPSPCVHDSTPVGGSYGGGRNKRPEDRDKSRRGGYTPAVSVRAALIGAEWMSQHGLAQAIPPAYTEWLGVQLAAEVAA